MFIVLYPIQYNYYLILFSMVNGDTGETVETVELNLDYCLLKFTCLFYL